MSSTPRFNRLGAIAGAVALVALGTIGFGQFNRPAQADAVLARGRAFGENRLICNAHWQSDVLQGRAVGAGAVAVLHANETFNADMRAARAEIDSLRGSGVVAQDCEAEATALKVIIPGVE